jgi:hypothetical protein
MATKVEIKLESTPCSPIPSNKKSLLTSEQDVQVQAIVQILGNILLTVKRDIIDKKGDLLFQWYIQLFIFFFVFFCLHS